MRYCSTARACCGVRLLAGEHVEVGRGVTEVVARLERLAARGRAGAGRPAAWAPRAASPSASWRRCVGGVDVVHRRQPAGAAEQRQRGAQPVQRAGAAGRGDGRQRVADRVGQVRAAAADLARRRRRARPRSGSVAVEQQVPHVLEGRAAARVRPRSTGGSGRSPRARGRRRARSRRRRRPSGPRGRRWHRTRWSWQLLGDLGAGTLPAPALSVRCPSMSTLILSMYDVPGREPPDQPRGRRPAGGAPGDGLRLRQPRRPDQPSGADGTGQHLRPGRGGRPAGPGAAGTAGASPAGRPRGAGPSSTRTSP